MKFNNRSKGYFFVSLRKKHRMLKTLSVIFIVISLIACNQSKTPAKKKLTKTNETAVKPVLAKGKITSAGIFSYYLPSNYSDTAKLPIFFIFDPQGDGNFPLNKYFPWAEQYGFILVASNVSKNGLPQNQLESIIRQFFQKVLLEFSVSENRMYAMGFSGGARVASMTILQNPKIRGLVLCGGGLAYRGMQGNKPDVLSFAGVKDFNMVELMNLDTFLLKNNCRHQLILFNGHHQWPDSLSMQEAFRWVLFNEMKDSIIPENQSLINQFLNEQKTKLAKETNPLWKDLLLRQIITFTGELTKTNQFQTELKQFENSASYRNYLKKFNRTIATEQQQEQSLVQAMETESFEWWKNKVRELSKDTGAGTMAAESHQRILNYLSLAAYMQSNNGLKSGQDNLAGHFIGLYQLIDPKNTEGYYMEAQLAAKQNNLSAAISALRKAVNLGFNDFDRMQNEQVFSPLYGNPQFEELPGKNR